MIRERGNLTFQYQLLWCSRLNASKETKNFERPEPRFRSLFNWCYSGILVLSVLWIRSAVGPFTAWLISSWLVGYSPEVLKFIGSNWFGAFTRLKLPMYFAHIENSTISLKLRVPLRPITDWKWKVQRDNIRSGLIIHLQAGHSTKFHLLYDFNGNKNSN